MLFAYMFFEGMTTSLDPFYHDVEGATEGPDNYSEDYDK